VEPLATRAAWPSWRRVAVAGMLVLLAAMLLGSQLPDPAALSPDELADLAASRPRALALARAIPAGRLLASPWLLAVPALLAAAIGWNVADRIRARRRSGPGTARFTARSEWSCARRPDEIAAALASRLARRGYRVRAEPPGEAHAIVARRGAVGFWGSIAFHLALVVALAAVAVSLLAEWRGEIHLVEGERLALDAPGAVRVGRRGPLSPSPPAALLELARCDVRYDDARFPVEYRADVVTLAPSGVLRQATIRVNGPASIEGQRLWLQSFGIAPVLEVDRGEERIAEGPVSLSIRDGREDRLDLPGSRDRLRVRWFGDAVRAGRAVRSDTDLPRNPALGLVLEPDGGGPARSVLLRRGQAARVGPYRIAFPEARYWVDLGIGRDPGAAVLLVALALASAGLAVRFWDHDREIRIAVHASAEGTRVAASARSRYFPALVARELEDLRAHS
jgi:cytochrome c biogenesis protein ResB